MIKTLLIANRGEIACRIIRSARARGVKTVAVHSEIDAAALHVQMADEARLIGPAPAKDSYLNIAAIIAAAKDTDADAIHPGYGFLSENADFARACAEAGLIFVGPPADAIARMGHKSEAKALMAEVGVPVVPGYHGTDQSDDKLAAEANAIGYPIMLKAAAGGGGRGMRLINDADSFVKALKGARREALSSFGDDTMLLEKFIPRPRHIEIQIFADQHGNILHLFERDCSIQRRHQKVVEEAPAPGMTRGLRARMGHAALAAASAVNYVGAGTVEFIVDGSAPLSDDSHFYFLEMNTRLQVEHPVTELITGQDLVAWQLDVADGKPLPCTQDDLSIKGHAIEVRLYAENPARNFFPQKGTLEVLQFPPEEDGLRIDTGVQQGDEVSIYYDPMLAKLVVWAENRSDAAAKLSVALRDTRLEGLTSNKGFLANALAHPAFLAGDVETGFIEKHKSDLIPDA